MSDTPRTDEVERMAMNSRSLHVALVAVLKHAGDLEREVAALREQLNAARTDYWALRRALKGKP